MRKTKIILTSLLTSIFLLGVSCSNTETLENERTPQETTEVTENVAVDETENNRDLVGEKITKIDESLVVSEMSGRYDYKVMQKDDMHYLVWEDENGEVQSAFLGDRTGLYSDETKSNKTVIDKIIQTEYSDIVTTNYVYSGAITVGDSNQVFVNKNNVAVSNMNVGLGYKVVDGAEQYVELQRFDDRVALLNDNIVEIYDDKTGELLQEINGVELYGEDLNNIYEFDGNGEIYNIQAVGEDFVVVNMLQPNIFSTVEEQDLEVWCYTTVINLETLEMIPVYQQLNCYKEGWIFTDGEMWRAYLGQGVQVGDRVEFVERNNDGKLVFNGYYDFTVEPGTETVEIVYK